VRRVIWSAPALRDIAAHVAYLDQFNPQAARALAAALLAAGDGLEALPLRGRSGRIAGTRELVARPPYVIIYEVSRDAVSILRVWHGAQLP
jgi:addiction module RelE/StbE family toxin